MFDYESNGFVVRTASIDRRIKKVVPSIPHPCFLPQWNYSRLMGHWVRDMCTIPWKINIIEYIWQITSFDCERMLGMRPRPSSSKPGLLLQLCSVSLLLKFFPKEYPRTAFEGDESQPVCTGNDGSLLKINKTRTDGSNDCVTICVIFMDNCIVLYGIPKYLLRDSGTDFANECLGFVFSTLYVGHQETICSNKPASRTLHQYDNHQTTMFFPEHQRKWDKEWSHSRMRTTCRGIHLLFERQLVSVHQNSQCSLQHWTFWQLFQLSPHHLHPQTQWEQDI